METQTNSTSTNIIPLVSGTHAQIKSLKDNSKLRPGYLYKITDFKTKYTQPVTNVVKESSTTEQLVLKATSINTFALQVYSTLYPKDYIEYDIDNIYCESPSTEQRKGKITFRKDTVNNNSTHYDFRFVRFDRGGSDVLTFGSNCRENSIGRYYSGGVILLNNIVFGNNSTHNRIEDTCYNMTFGLSARANVIENNCSEFQVGDNFVGNIIKPYSTGFTIGNNCNTNYFGYNTITAVLPDGCIRNIFGQIKGVNALNCKVAWKNVIIESDTSFASIDFTLATVVADAYTKHIYNDKTLGIRMSWMDNNLLVVDSPNI